MADIKQKSIESLSTWNKKELRKLRMIINNRISSLSGSKESKALPVAHPLFNFEVSQCRELLEKVVSAESKI